MGPVRTMAEIVVDTSVVVKWYIPEQHHEQARALRDAYLDGAFDQVTPALMPFEAVNALKYSGYYDEERLEDASKSLFASTRSAFCPNWRSESALSGEQQSHPDVQTAYRGCGSNCWSPQALLAHQRTAGRGH